MFKQEVMAGEKEKTEMPASPLRIGRISYLNLYPIFRGLEKTVEDAGRYRFLYGHPALVNRRLRKGDVDASPSSSIVYLKSPADFSLIEGHSISCFGPIRSIYLFSRLPLTEFRGGTIGVTNQTETSAALLKIVLKKFLGMNFKARVTGLPAARALQTYGACLAIGDEAMIAGKQMVKKGQTGSTFVYDLGLIWKEKTGLPFVFALWIARKDSVAQNKKAFRGFRRDLERAKQYALAHLEEASKETPLKGLAPEDVLRYWRGISYGLDPMEKKGLALFRKYAKELDLL